MSLGRPGIISVGHDRHSWPRSVWGSRDWEEELKEQPLDVDPPVGPPPPPLVPAGWYRRKPRRGSDSARSRAIDAKLEQLGVRGRR